MIALISPAKTMRSNSINEKEQKRDTTPRFMAQTDNIASLMLNYSTQELEEIFKISTPLAKELKKHFINLFDPSIATTPAIDSYDGVVFKHFKDKTPLTKEDKLYLQNNLRISSLLFGLLRPLDGIKPYRMEGFIRLAGSDERVDRYWRDHQTQTLIDDVKKNGNTLLYLASKEEQNGFHWRQVKNSVRVIDFQFLQHKGDKLKQVVVYTKMARGEIIRYMIDNRISDPNELKNFEWGGYKYNDTLSKDDLWVWVME